VSAPTAREVVDFLGHTAVYPDESGAVECVETHMSWVFLTARHAYKLKKAVRWDGLDFSTPELRRRDCEAELRLNRRLARDVYLRVVPLTRDARGGLALDGVGEPVDWLVEMRRLPAARMLDQMIAKGLDEADVRPAAMLLARFFAQAPAVESSGAAYRSRLADGTRSDERALCRPAFELPAERVRRLAAAQLSFLAERAALFDRRVRDGRIVEGHGDLRPEHVCLADPPSIIDCLEFSRALRTLDPADELAFLALECERLGRPLVGRWFFEAYAEETKDAPPPELVAFHRRYRALRRAKIAIRHLDARDVTDAEKWRTRALVYLDLAGAGD